LFFEGADADEDVATSAKRKIIENLGTLGTAFILKISL
jgi:hypothetical protein